MSTVLKLKYASEVRRVRLGEEEPTYAAVCDAIERAWPSLVDAKAKYRDEDGDLCTLIEATFSDFLAAYPGGAEKRVLVLELVPNPTPPAPPPSARLRAAPLCAGPMAAMMAGAGDPLALALPALFAHKLGSLAEMAGSMPCGMEWQEKAAFGCFEKAVVWVFAQLRGAGIPAGKTAAAALVHFLPKIVERLPMIEKVVDLPKALRVPVLKDLLEDTRAVVAGIEGLQHCEGGFAALLSEEEEASAPAPGCAALTSLVRALSEAPAAVQVAFAEALVERQQQRYEAKVQEVPQVPLPLEHSRIICDGCEMGPLKGLRFKSKARPDYDLCAQCFALQAQGQESEREEFECIPIDGPGLFQFFHHKMAKGFCDPKGKGKGKGKGKCGGRWAAAAAASSASSSDRQEEQGGWDSKAWWEWKQQKNQDWKNKWGGNWGGNDWVKKVGQPEWLKKQLVWLLTQAQEGKGAVAMLLHYLPKIIGKLAHCIEKEEFDLRKIMAEAPEARRILEDVHGMIAEREHLLQCEPGFALMLSDSDEPAEQALMFLLTTVMQLPVEQQVEFAEALLARAGRQLQEEVASAKESSWQVSPEHPRHECDGCGMFPMAGPRFHCDEDYDLCAACYIQKGTPSSQGEHASRTFKCIPVDWRAHRAGKGWGGGRRAVGEGNDGYNGAATSGAASGGEEKSKEPQSDVSCEDEQWTDVVAPQDEAFEVVSFPELSEAPKMADEDKMQKEEGDEQAEKQGEVLRLLRRVRGDVAPEAPPHPLPEDGRQGAWTAL